VILKSPFIYLLIPTILLIASFAANSQCGAQYPYSSNGGRFSVNEIKGCVGLKVEICISEPSCDCVSCSCDILFGDGNGDAFTYTYNQPGTYRMEILFPNPTPSDFINIVITDKDEPDFNLYACAGNIVNVDIQDKQYDNYFIDFGDGSQITVPIGSGNQQHIYPNTIARTVTVQGIDNNALDNCAIASDNFTPRVTLPASLISSLKILDDSSLELNYTLSSDLLYRLEIQPGGSGNFNFLRQLDPQVKNDTIKNLDLINNFYCLRVSTFNPCTNVSTYSNTICSINLNLNILDGTNELVWTTKSPSGNFSLARKVINNNGSSTTNPYQTFSPSIRDYTNSDIICNTNYCYSLEADYNGGRSYSKELCGLSISTLLPPAVNDIALVVSGNEVQIQWPDAINTLLKEYSVFRNNVLVSKTADSEFIDINANGNTQPFCYSINISDECGNENNQGINACSIFLQGSISSNNTVTLFWEDYTGYQNGVGSYSIEKYYQNQLVSTSTTSIVEFIEVDNNTAQQVIIYRIIANPNDINIEKSVSNYLSLTKPNNIYYPTAFTPDGNNSNETFNVKGQFIVEYQMQIFNRWGEMIFNSDNQENGWDGTVNGKPQQEGTYIFNLEIVDFSGKNIKKNGSFVLIRK
jgi:gliding motility-associated-like protein